MNLCKIFDQLKLIFTLKKENSPSQKVLSKTKTGNSASISGNSNSIQQSDTINNYYPNPSDSSEQKIIKNLLNEMDYNISPGVGCPKCHFEFAHHNKLLDSKIRQDLHETIRELIKHMKLCNAYAGTKSLKRPPGNIKEQSKILKTQLINKPLSSKED